jgi:hypothetical protein
MLATEKYIGISQGYTYIKKIKFELTWAKQFEKI